MASPLDLNLLALRPRLRTERREGKLFLFGYVRRKWLVATPEELVRQLFLHHLTERAGFPLHRLSVEKTIKLHGLSRRTDILVYDRDTQPWLLVECKRPEVRLDDAVFRQIAWYNMPLRVPYLVVTNGRETYVCSIDFREGRFEFLEGLPGFGDG